MEEDFTKITFDPDNPIMDYQAENYIKAIEQVTKYYFHGHGAILSLDHAADALEMYAKHLRGNKK